MKFTVFYDGYAQHIMRFFFFFTFLLMFTM